MNRPALLIVNNFHDTTQSTSMANYERVSEKIQSLYLAFKADHLPIFSVQDNYFCTYENEMPYSPPPYRDSNAEILVGKHSLNCFYRTCLAKRLKEMGINEVILSGYSTDKSIAATVNAALQKNMQVTLASDAHSTVDNPFVPAERLVESYNDMWKKQSLKHANLTLSPTELLLERF